MREPLMRVNVIGTSGSGKSTFSRQLAQRINQPYIEMDQIFWKPAWEMPLDSVFFRDLGKALDQPGWVLDGNYTRTIPVKWARVQMVVWLDYSFPRTLWQALKRAISRARTKEELWPGTGNRESFRRSFFSKDSIIWWTITTHRKVRNRCEAYLQDPQYRHIRFVRLKCPREAVQFLSAPLRDM